VKYFRTSGAIDPSNLPTWIIGPALSEKSLMGNPPDFLKVWPTRAKPAVSVCAIQSSPRPRTSSEQGGGPEPSRFEVSGDLSYPATSSVPFFNVRERIVVRARRRIYRPRGARRLSLLIRDCPQASQEELFSLSVCGLCGGVARIATCDVNR
jgi:hypothetical protein